jgi:hypothetical protein
MRHISKKSPHTVIRRIFNKLLPEKYLNRIRSLKVNDRFYVHELSPQQCGYVKIDVI